MPTVFVYNAEGLKSCLDLQPQKPTRILHGSLMKCDKANVKQKQYASEIKKHHLPKNFDMCAETLGCETGEAYGSHRKSSLTASSSPQIDCFGLKEEIDRIRNVRKRGSTTSTTATASEFPPPLATLGGESCLHLARKRENGRLLLVAYKPSVIEAERSCGHLILRLLPGTRVPIKK